MQFEGPEKKLEITCLPSAGSLREKGVAFWSRIVADAKAEIISQVSNVHADAYLLSESSLFVFDDRVLLITCGQTTPVSAANSLIAALGKDQIQMLIYERKNEHFPEEQPTTFEDDARTLQSLVPGEVNVFGNPLDHFISVFHISSPYDPPQDDATLEILMHGIDEEVLRLFSSEPDKARSMLLKGRQIDGLLKDWLVDDHVFSPQGYSLNALREESYLTIHVTPEQQGSYVSFETNRIQSEDDLRQTLQRVVGFFAPKRADAMYFHPKAAPTIELEQYQCASRENRPLDCGYIVSFAHFTRSP